MSRHKFDPKQIILNPNHKKNMSFSSRISESYQTLSPLLFNTFKPSILNLFSSCIKLLLKVTNYIY